jgi:secernin
MCDTFVALSPATADGSVVFGKNSDRPAGEAQAVRRFAGGRHAPGSTVRCTYVEIPQAPRTFATLLSKIGWMWGAEMGANEPGVVIGNEAVWTREPAGPPALLGMDLVRLGLERGETAREALEVITGLLERFGQGGPCAENDPSFTYHNSFLIADASEAWVLETAGEHWAAEHVTEGVRNISNGLTIRAHFDLCSPGLVDHARRRGLCDGAGAFDFAAAFSATPVEPGPDSRQACGRVLLSRRFGRMTPDAMMDILKDHESGICMHGPFETTASMVSRIAAPYDADHWFTGGPHPCRRPFRSHFFHGGAGGRGQPTRAPEGAVAGAPEGSGRGLA